MPAIYQFPEQAEEGGFIGYGPNIIQISREITARMLAKVLRGTNRRHPSRTTDPSRQAAFFGPTVANGALRTLPDLQLAPPSRD